MLLDVFQTKENDLDSDKKCLTRKQYLHKSATILTILDISHNEEEQLHLISIMSKYEYKRRNNEYTLNLDRLKDFETIQTLREKIYREILCYLYRKYCLLANMTQE
ncbi:hypothetical protein [Clostridium neonatale]|nr:hypothetical protein [Clostridium neonatale]CAI3620694.1 hypothetical protein CNEO4_1990001 [Clostridium neonatale]